MSVGSPLISLVTIRRSLSCRTNCEGGHRADPVQRKQWDRGSERGLRVLKDRELVHRAVGGSQYGHYQFRQHRFCHVDRVPVHNNGRLDCNTVLGNLDLFEESLATIEPPFPTPIT